MKSPPFVVAAHAKRLTMVAWSLHSRDTCAADPARVAARVLRRIRPGDIVLMHDGHDLPGHHRTACAGAVPLILAGLRERGLECVTVSELLRQPEREPPSARPLAVLRNLQRPCVAQRLGHPVHQVSQVQVYMHAVRSTPIGIEHIRSRRPQSRR